MSIRVLTLRRSSRSTLPAPRRVWALIAGSLGVAAAAAVLLVSSHGHLGRPSLPWPAIAAGLVLSELVVIDVTSSEASMSIMLTGLPAALALAYLSPMGLLGAFSIEAIAYSVRFGKSWYKTAFNIANALTSASVAYLVVGAIRGSGSSVSAVGILGIGAGLAALQMTGTIGILIANGVSSGKIHWSHVRASYLESLVTLALDIPLGILAVILAYRQAWTLLLLAGPVVLIAFWNRTVKTIRKRYSNLQLMYDFSVKLAGVPDTDSIIRTALDETRVLFACQQSQLVLPLGTGAYRYELSGEGTRVHELGFLSTIEEEVVSNGRPALVSKTDTGEEPHEFEDLMAVVVPLGDIGNGVLVAGNHNSDSESFDTEDLRLFETLAAHLSTALTSSRRLDQLRSEMAAREHQALHDSLTGLANRTMFAQRVCIALEHHRIEELVAVMLMDLDGFKDINDSLGHPAGDTLLKEVAARIETEFGPNGTVARLGGDEFAFVFPSLGSGTEAKALARSVLDAVSKPISLDGMLLELRGSMGLALAPQHGTEASVLLQKADVAMYEAKDSKRGVVAYNSDMDRSAKRRLTLASGLRRAFESGQLEVWYQPVARADTGRVAGCEALLRWRTDIEFVPPSEFIPVAEQTGLIEPLTWWVLESSLRQLGRWQSEDLGQTVAVNLSARCLQSSDVVARVNELLRRTGVTAESLILEVTESLIMSDPEASRVILGDLAELGVRIAVDDFGTGHSSMSRLKRMPVHSLKIDREFVMNMHIDRSDEAIVRACIELARALGHTVTAEGVENFETWEQLRRLGCNDIQGYLLAAAMPPEECLDWMRARRQLDFGPDFALLRKVVGGA